MKANHPVSEPQAAQASNFRRQALREPLLHFVLLGALIFGVDRWVNAGEADAQLIHVTADVQQEARQIFEAGMKRPPEPAELQVLIDRWVDNEILYREGLALGLDRGDKGIRDRVIFKAHSVTQAGLAIPEIEEDGLRKWFEARRDKYDVPARFDFLEAVVSGDTSPEALKRFVAALNGDGESDAESSLRVFKDRPRTNLLQSYGPDFTAAIEKAAPGKWHVIAGKDGLHVVRLEAIKPGQAADFAAIKPEVYQDWRDEATSVKTKELIQDMGKKYTVRVDPVQAQKEVQP